MNVDSSTHITTKFHCKHHQYHHNHYHQYHCYRRHGRRRRHHHHRHHHHRRRHCRRRHHRHRHYNTFNNVFVFLPHVTLTFNSLTLWEWS